MSLLGLFATPVGAMMAQSKKMETIGTNIANVNTGGYKRLETNFSTMVSKSYGNNNDIGGVRGMTRALIDQGGSILSSNSNFDLAISGNGFFVLNSAVDGSGDTVYGRDGMFQQGLGEEITFDINGGSVTTNAGYLADKNGYFVQGWPVNPDFQTFNTTGNPESIRIDPEAYTVQGESTTEASLFMNLPSDLAPNSSETTSIQVYDDNGDLSTYRMRFSNYTLGEGTTAATPAWNVPSGVVDGYSETAPITIYNSEGLEETVDLTWTKTGPDTWEVSASLGGTDIDIDGVDDGVANAVSVSFDPATGEMINPPAITVNTPTETGASFTLDLGSMTQNNVGVTMTDTNILTIDGIRADQVENQWTLEMFDIDGNPVALDDDTDPNRTFINFNGDASLISPLSLSIESAAANFTLDLSRSTQYASGQTIERNYDFNGRSNARMRDFYFTPDGTMIGRFDDATQRPLYKLPLATFTNANALEAINGNVYRYDPNAGEQVLREAGGQGAGVFLPNSREISNVVMEDEFSAMIVTQNAYNTASTLVQTIDEMTEVARDLK